LGMAVVFLMHLNEDSFAVSDQLSAAFDLPILGTVTKVGVASQQLELRREALSLAAALGVLVLGYGTLLVVSQLQLFSRLGGLL